METFDTTIQKTNIWLKDLMDEEGWEDIHKSYLAMRAALHALRDRLTPEEASQLASELPMLVRGFYYEGWSPANKPKKLHTKQEFLKYLAEGLPDDPELDPERVARGVFAILAKKISRGEIQDVKKTLPPEIRELWPSSI
jgi:uncharacterized protein (DUF2267 family)